MSSPVTSLTSGLSMEDPVVQQFLERHHGGPVVDAESGAVVGVLSRNDLYTRHREKGSRTVAEIMTAPPICVRAKAHVAEAAGLMLQHKVHRLPVVDERNVPIGIVTRTDVFEPLISKQQDLLSNQERRWDTVLHQSYPARGESKFGTGESWEEEEEDTKHKRRKMQKAVEEYYDEVGLTGLDVEVC